MSVTDLQSDSILMLTSAPSYTTLFYMLPIIKTSQNLNTRIWLNTKKTWYLSNPVFVWLLPSVREISNKQFCSCEDNQEPEFREWQSCSGTRPVCHRCWCVECRPSLQKWWTALPFPVHWQLCSCDCQLSKVCSLERSCKRRTRCCLCTPDRSCRSSGKKDY